MGCGIKNSFLGLTATSYVFYNARLVGSLAQLVEQRTFNPLVAGSNPARPTTNKFQPAFQVGSSSDAE